VQTDLAGSKPYVRFCSFRKTAQMEPSFPKKTASKGDGQTIDTNIEDENNNQQLEDNNQPTDNNEDNNQPENIDNNDSSSDDKENENDNDNDNKDNENKDNVIDMKDKKNEKKSLLKDSGKDKPKEDGETKKSIRDKYKTQDNIVFNAKAKETKFEEVRKYSDKTYSCELNGRQLATMFLDGTLIYDPSMQRGVKEDKNNVLRANFKERHVNEIAKAMTEGTFTSLTQIHLGLITDDEDFIDPIYEDGDLIYNGKVRLIDGQHRTKACVKIFSLEKLDELKTDIDLEDIVFNVVIDVVNSDEARIIYQGIDKNLKLDKSQARQLSSDDYARIVNALNTSPDSDLKGKIATAKPTGDKLVLFNNLADSIQKTFGKFNGTNERKATEKYLMEFFAYVTEKLPKAFGNNGADRVEFRSNNLLNENNFFLTWIRLAFVDKENYQANIDKIVENVNFFNKDTQNADGEYIWWKANAIKAKENNKKGFAMQNTGSGINNLTKLTFELLGIKTEQNEEVASDGENGVEVSEQ
jgi:hypothetical protein